MFAIMSGRHLFSRARGERHLEMVDVTASYKRQGFGRCINKLSTACLELLFWNSIALIDVLSKECFFFLLA